jgi:AcrR family transcriptional regulator
MSARRAIPGEANDSLWQAHKRQSIQEAVIRLMCREGLKSVTMERVAQEVGIAKGTVYLHYRDKQELLDAVKESSLAPLRERLDEILRTRGMSAERKLHSYATRYLSYFDERRDLFRILLYEREVTRVQNSRYSADTYKHRLDEVARVFREGIRDGSFREVDPHRVAAMFVEANVAIVNQRLLREKPAAVEEDASLIIDTFLRGLNLPPGSSR